MKKVLFGITSLNIGGAEKTLVLLANKLSYEQDITIYTIYKNNFLEKELNSNIKVFSLTNFDVKCNSFIKRVIGLFISVGLYDIKVKKISSNYDLIISFLEGPVTKLFSCVNKRKIAWIHTDLSNHYKRFRWSHLLKTYLKYDRLVFVSKYSLDKFSIIDKNNLLSKRKKIIYNFFDYKDIKNKSMRETFEYDDYINFLCVSRLVEAKGIERLIKVHKRLIDEGYYHRIYIIGEGPLHNKLDLLIDLNNIKDTFILLGQKDNPYPYMKDCTYYLSASLYEGYGNTLVEAKILNKYILLTNCASVEAVSDYPNKTIIENNEESLYSILKEFIINKKVSILPYEYKEEESLNKVRELIEGASND